MRALIVLVVVVLVLAAVGWITFGYSSDKASVNIETEKIQQDTEQLVEGTKDLANDAREGINRMTDDTPAEGTQSVPEAENNVENTPPPPPDTAPVNAPNAADSTDNRGI